MKSIASLSLRQPGEKAASSGTGGGVDASEPIPMLFYIGSFPIIYSPFLLKIALEKLIAL